MARVVLDWHKSAAGWRGLVRFAQMTSAAYTLNYEHWLDAGTLEPVE